MPSPFPGMNPWLEQPDVWHDFHQAFVTMLRAAIAEQIRPQYITKIDENVYIHEFSYEDRVLLGRPDVAVLEGRAAPSLKETVPSAAVPLAVGQLPPAAESFSEAFIEIRDREHRDLITVIELLSPTNKQPGPDREHYLVKRKRLLASSVHLVEIDLLRDGPRMPLQENVQCDYLIMVSRSWERPTVGLWPMALRDPLPKIPIPLKREHPDALVDLQALLHQTYDAAGYADYIYTGNPRPALNQQDNEWAQQLLKLGSN